MSHRSKLTITATLASGLLLGLVLIGLYLYSRSQDMRANRELLSGAITQLLEDLRVGGAKPDLKEVHDANPRITLAVFSDDGTLTDRAGSLDLEPLEGQNTYDKGNSQLTSVGVRSKQLLMVAGLDLTEQDVGLRGLGLLLFGIWILAMLLVGAATWCTVNATFRPLKELSEQATRYGGHDLSVRLNSRDRAEFGQFTQQLNLLLARIQETAMRQEEFASNAAHELRTPLAILRTGIDTALLNRRTEDEYRKTLSALIPEVDRLTRLVEMLLRSARLDPAPAPKTELSEVVNRAASRWLSRFEVQSVGLQSKTETAWAHIWPEEMNCVLDNLLENALRFSPRGSTCTLEVSSDGDIAQVTLTDEGPGVPEKLEACLFDRFTRGQVDVGTSEGGYGIGLSLCRNIVVARNGSLSVTNTHPGAQFRIEIGSA